MKRAVFALVVVMAICLVGCGSASSASSGGSSQKSASAAASAASGSSAQRESLPDRNGFDEETNQAVTIAGVDFSFPSYIEKTSDKDWTSNYSVSDDSGSEGNVVITYGSPPDKVASVEKFQANKESVISNIFSSDSYRNVQITDVEEGGIADLPSGIYTVSGDFVVNGKATGFVSKACIFLNDSLNIGMITLMQLDGAKNDYIPDFDKVLASASVSEQEEEESDDQGDSGDVNPDLKEMLDSYEAFMDEYVEFMKEYQNSGDTMGMLQEYTEYMQRYTDFMQEVDDVDTSDMSAADYEYYIDVTSRVSKKLLEVSGI